MERYLALINKLYQQKEQGENVNQLLATVQLIHAELLNFQPSNNKLGSAKVAVTMPVNFGFLNGMENEGKSGKHSESDKPFVEKEKEKEKEAPTLTTSIADLAGVEEQPAPAYSEKPYVLNKPVVEEKPAVKPAPANNQSSFFPAWEASEEAPTLVQHQAKEIHELISTVQESLNDKLKEEKIELASRLKDSPIKDLRKAIGINDRFTFVTELFRGDEAMYERSIKTINGFNIYTEAEYWMSRELKLKLGWNENAPTVRHFYQLVRRRFS